MKALLINREFETEGNWHQPSKFLGSYKSVVAVKLINTTSSAGDWSGVFVQKLHGKYYYIVFWQENQYPSRGFSLSTDNKFSVSNEFSEELILDAYQNAY